MHEHARVYTHPLYHCKSHHRLWGLMSWWARQHFSLFLLPTQLFHGSKSHFYILPALAKVTSSKRAGDHQNPRAWPHVAVCEVKCSLLPHVACSVVLSIHLLGTKDTHWQKSPLVEWIKSTIASSWCHIPPSDVASSWQAAGMLWNAPGMLWFPATGRDPLRTCTVRLDGCHWWDHHSAHQLTHYGWSHKCISWRNRQRLPETDVAAGRGEGSWSA